MAQCSSNLFNFGLKEKNDVLLHFLPLIFHVVAATGLRDVVKKMVAKFHNHCTETDI